MIGSMGQYGPTCPGIRGVHDIYGNVFSVTYGFINISLCFDPVQPPQAHPGKNLPSFQRRNERSHFACSSPSIPYR